MASITLDFQIIPPPLPEAVEVCSRAIGEQRFPLKLSELTSEQIDQIGADWTAALHARAQVVRAALRVEAAEAPAYGN